MNEQSCPSRVSICERSVKDVVMLSPLYYVVLFVIKIGTVYCFYLNCSKVTPPPPLKK